MISFRSIGFKLAAWYTSLLGVTFILLIIVAYSVLNLNMAHNVDYALEKIGTVMVEKARAEGQSPYPDIDELFQHFFGFSPLNRQAEIFDTESQKNYELNSLFLHKLKISPEAMANALEGKSYYETQDSETGYSARILTIPVIESGRFTHLIRVGMSLEHLHKAEDHFFIIMAAIFPIGILLAGGGGWLFARKALRPIDKIEKTVRKISGEDLSQRLEESGNGDELDRLAATLNSMLDRLHSAFSQMRQFSGDASHELQTPLTILQGEMEVALRKERSPEEYQDVLGSSLEEIGRINHLVEGLLLLARADSGVLCLDLQSTDMKQLAEAVVDQMHFVAEPGGILLEFEVSATLYVLGDQDHLRRMLINLISNAIKYSNSGGRVRVSLCLEDDWVVLRVADEGVGIAENELTNIFNRFHRVTESGARDSRGVGLGLSIVDSIVKAHQGSMEIQSSPGQGSTFSVYLPHHFPEAS